MNYYLKTTYIHISLEFYFFFGEGGVARILKEFLNGITLNVTKCSSSFMP